jgi:adenine deaminase
MIAIALALLQAATPPAASASEPALFITGGHYFDVAGQRMVANPGIVVRAGKLVRIGPSFLSADTAGARPVTLGADEYLLPGFIDLHAHYAIDLFGGGRIDDVDVYPALFLALSAARAR